MFINSDNKIKIKATHEEWAALKDKMMTVANYTELQPAPPNTLIFYLWGYNFMDCFNFILRKTNKPDLFGKIKDVTITLPMVYAITVHLSCRPLSEDSNYLRKIIGKIDKALPIEIVKTNNNFLGIN